MAMQRCGTMSSSTGRTDADGAVRTGDEFDELLNLEERFLAEGYSQGLAHGEAAGHADGRALGERKGLEIGREVGRYRGRVATLLALYAAHPELASARMRSTLNSAAESLGRISLEDPLDQGCFDLIEDVRAKMRMVELWLLGGSRRGLEADGDPSAGAAPSQSSSGGDISF